MRRMRKAVVRRPDTRVARHVDVSALSLGMRPEAMAKLATCWGFSSVLQKREFEERYEMQCAVWRTW